MSESKPEGFPWRTLIAGVVVYVVVQAWLVGLAGISGSSEAREAQVIDIIRREGSWILPLRNGVIPSKPPLYHWSGALVSAAVGGVSEFSARITSQLYAAVVVLLVSLVVYRFACRTRTFQSAQHPARSALCAAAIVSLTYGFYQLGCQAMVDMTFTFCVWGALASVMYVDVGPSLTEKRSFFGWRGFFWLFCALGMLARGPLGLVLPVYLIGIAAICVLGFRRGIVEILRPSAGWLAFLLPLTWYCFAYLEGGEHFIGRQLLFENVKRFAGGDFVNNEAWWFYLPSVLRTTFPWSVLVLLLASRAIAAPRSVSYREHRRLVRWLPSVLLLAGMFIFSLSSGKRHSYMVPLLPFVGVQLSVELSTLWERAELRRRERLVRLARTVRTTLGVGMIIGLIGLIAVSFIDLGQGPQVSVLAPELARCLERLFPLLLACAAVSLMGPRDDSRQIFSGAWLSMMVVMSSLIATGAVVKAYYKGFDSMTASMLQLVRPSDRLVIFKHPFDEYFDPMLYYAHRPVTLLMSEGSRFECEDHTLYVGKRTWLESNQSAFAGHVQRVAIARERLRMIKGDDSRDVVFFRCSHSSVPEGMIGPPAMRDAGLRLKGKRSRRG